MLFGAGGHAKVILDIIEKQNAFRIEGLIDPARTLSEISGYPVLKSLPPKVRLGIVAVGDNFRRSTIVTDIINADPGFRFAIAIHPSACVGRGVQIGAGSVVMAGTCLNPGIMLGEHCVVNTRASIDHDCKINNFASIAPGATLGGEVKVGDYSAVGLGASCIHGIHIGAHTVIGAGSVLIEHIPAKCLAYGNPCRVVRQRKPGEKYL